MCAIAVESTDWFSAAHTGGVLRQFLTSLFGPISPETLETINHALRKAGHFLGYAGLSCGFYRGISKSYSALGQLAHGSLALLGTAFVASMDEFHQSFLPSRTSSIQDVGLDTLGAVVMQVLIVATVSCSSRQRREETSPSN